MLQIIKDFGLFSQRHLTTCDFNSGEWKLFEVTINEMCIKNILQANIIFICNLSAFITFL